MGSKPRTSGDGQLAAAPTAFVTYAHGDQDWNATVLDFATALRVVGGIDADLDRWHEIGGQNWNVYGPKAIDQSDVILIAISDIYKQAWHDEGPPDRHAGAAREATAIQGIYNQDRADFQRRVKVVILQGASTTHIPNDLSGAERFEVTEFDASGLEQLLRSILDKPSQPMPALGRMPFLPPLSALPPDSVARVRTSETLESDDEPQADVQESAAPTADDNRAQADELAALLERIDLRLASTTPDDERDRLAGQRKDVKASLEAVERTLPTGVLRQRTVGNYLNAQLYFSAGAYRAADRRLHAVVDSLGDDASDPSRSPLEPCLRKVAEAMLALTEGMRAERYAADTDARHPKPPDYELADDSVQGVRAFYEVARRATSPTTPTKRVKQIRKAILRGREEKHCAGLYERFTRQQGIAMTPLDLDSPSASGDGTGALVLATTRLDDATNSVAADVIEALTKAHLDIHLVEHRRSGTVGEILERGNDEIDQDNDLLRRSIVLNTFALQITEALPWIFAADELERDAVQVDEEVARRELKPARAMWPARQVTLLALYRRSHGFRLLGDHERAYHDLRKLQRLGRLTLLAHPDDANLIGWVGTIEALAEYRVGELYRADHDYMQALVHLCRSHDSVHGLYERPGSTIACELGHLQIKLCLGKGKAFFEIGAMKRSLKWHLAAWRWLRALDSPGASDLDRQLVAAEKQLDDVKHDPVLYKPAVHRVVGPVLDLMCRHDLAPEHRALEADILIRISHLITAVRLQEDRTESSADDSSALRCMLRAEGLDPRNLLVQTGLLRYEMRRERAIPGRDPGDALRCWPSGASDVDQMIRVAEHLMLERLHAAGSRGTGRADVARALMGHFMTHTDSINLRGAILHRYLMRRRAEDREPQYDDDPSAGVQRALAATTNESSPYLEFVCLRRFGSFTPFMPRPAAVSAVGGGYLVRVVHPPSSGVGRPSISNIVVDPGEGAVNNLYAMGLSIADIDMVIATHDHPEHLAALDAILSLRREFRERQRVRPRDHDDEDVALDLKRRLLILGNRSVVNRYSFLNGDGDHLVQHIFDASVLGGDYVPAGVSIVQLRTKHEDLGGHHASGFVLGLESCTPGGRKATLRIAFMSDTSIDGLHEDADPKKDLRSEWEIALRSDIVVAHVSDVPIDELRELAELPSPSNGSAVDAFDRGVRKLFAERSADASQLMHALSLVASDPGDPPVSLVDARMIDRSDQLYLRGLLDILDLMRDAAASAGVTGRILVVGELKEQLGSFRGTIAREINRRVLQLDEARKAKTAPPVVALTADIGLRIRLTPTQTDSGQVHGSSTVLCSTCSYNNDRLDMERFHPPQWIWEVCIKGDHEAMYWNCDLHDPGTRLPPKFVEQMGGYNPFAAGGRYHG